MNMLRFLPRLNEVDYHLIGTALYVMDHKNKAGNGKVEDYYPSIPFRSLQSIIKTVELCWPEPISKHSGVGELKNKLGTFQG